MRRMQASDRNVVRCAIWDIDGVLLDIRPLLDRHIFNREPGTADWPAFNAGLATCEPIQPYVDLCRALWIGGVRIELLTSRAESLREVTEECLRLHGVLFDGLSMRPDGVEHNGSKLEQAAALAERYDILCCFEDDPVNISAFRHMGLQVVAVDSGYHNHPWVPGVESADIRA